MAHPAEIRMKPMREPNFSRPSVVLGVVLMRALLSESKMKTMAMQTPPSRMCKPKHYTQQNELMQKRSRCSSAQLPKAAALCSRNSCILRGWAINCT